MSVELSIESENEVGSILYGHMSPQKAAEYLYAKNISSRSFSETLASMYSGENALDMLISFYLIIEPGVNLQSLKKRLRNWLSDKNQPNDREDFFRIAYALRLGIENLNFLLGLCTDYGIQYRNGRELVLSWFLNKGYGYSEACEFYKTLDPVTEMNTIEPGVTSRITHEIHNEFSSVQSVSDLRKLYNSYGKKLGTLHIRSYYYFDKFFSQLVSPTQYSGADEQSYSIDDVMNSYLSMNIPSGRDRTGYSLIQKLIKHNWPNTTSLKNIRNHTEDVPRKLLLLLYVATENSLDSDPYRETDEEYITLEERVKDHWWTINAMLGDCGMALLDTRNASDWLILYSIAAEPDEAMSERMENVISELYGDSIKGPL